MDRHLVEDPRHVSRVWLYQLQHIVPDKLVERDNDRFGILTIDYTLDGDDRRQITRDDINKFHAKRKLVLGYLSVGEAEEYRSYFDKRWVKKEGKLQQPNPQTAPKWLGRTNREWEDNYKVKYWDPDWQALTMQRIDRLVDIGFDGVYLDIVDAFTYWSDPMQLRMAGEKRETDSGPLSEKEAARLMIDFVLKIAYHARVVRNAVNFQVIPQNAEEILQYDEDGRYLYTINGIGVEDLFYDELEAVEREETEERLTHLRKVSDAGKLVLVVDYVDDGKGYLGPNRQRIDDFLDKVAAERFYCYVAKRDRELDRVVKTGLYC